MLLILRIPPPVILAGVILYGIWQVSRRHAAGTAHDAETDAAPSALTDGFEPDDDVLTFARGRPAARRSGPPAAAVAPPDPAYLEDFAAMIGGLGLRHFSPEEFLVLGGQNEFGECKGLNRLPPRENWPRIGATAKVLDELRERLGAAITTTSVYRNQAYNDCISGSAPESLHKSFNAVDFKCAEGRPADWARELKRMRDADQFKGGIGVYGTFVHVDTRGFNANFGPNRAEVFG